jgi:hypothetical protein
MAFRFIKLPPSLDPLDIGREVTNIPSLDEVADRFERCLSEAKREQDIHDFFEQYPHVLPGMDTYHNGPLANLVVTKFPLGSDFITDFAFVSENSQAMEMTFVEIESPTQRIFRRDGSFSREYLDAKQQLADWNAWAQHNLRTVADLFGPLRTCIQSRYIQLSLRCILVFGRRSELKGRKRQERWAAENALRAASMNIMTYDRLLERIQHGFVWSFKKRVLISVYKDREFHVKHTAIR